jgi:hypothetical protein
MRDAERAELHRHIQGLVFGRQRETAPRFDELQDRLHELVDGAGEREAVEAFVRRVHARASRDGQKYRLAINAELEALEGAHA